MGRHFLWSFSKGQSSKCIMYRHLTSWSMFNSILITTQGENPTLYPFKEPNDKKQCYDIIMTTDIAFIVIK